MKRNDIAPPELQSAQRRIDLGCAVEALRLIAYSPAVNRTAAQMADGFLRGWARRHPCTECGDPADFVWRDGTFGCYACARSAGRVVGGQVARPRVSDHVVEGGG